MDQAISGLQQFGGPLMPLRRSLTAAFDCGHTFGMKTAMSIPDGPFKRAKRFAPHVRMTRDQVYSEALKEYIARQAPDTVTEAKNFGYAA